MTRNKMLECIRPNGEKILIPKLEKQGLPQTSRREIVTFIVEHGEFKMVPYVEEEKRQTHMIITDDIPEMECHACKGHHSSKSAFRNCYKRHGMLEVGNESLEIRPDDHDAEALDRKLEDDITWAFNALKNDEAPMDELTRERCKVMDKQIKDSGDNRLRSHDGTLLEGTDD